jgi:hypothetical protein
MMVGVEPDGDALRVAFEAARREGIARVVISDCSVRQSRPLQSAAEALGNLLGDIAPVIFMSKCYWRQSSVSMDSLSLSLSLSLFFFPFTIHSFLETRFSLPKV